MITQELQNKLVTRCQHPRTVVNKYTRESVVVSCGSCPALFFALLGHPSQLSFEQLDAPLQLLFSGIFFPP